MLHLSLSRWVDNPYYAQIVHFDSFVQFIGSLDNNTPYIFREKDVNRELYHGSEKIILWKQLKERVYLSRLIGHLTHTYHVYSSDGRTELFSYAPTWVQERVAQVLHH